MTKVVARGFTPIMTPDLVKESVLDKCGFQPRGTNTQVRLSPSGVGWTSGGEEWGVDVDGSSGGMAGRGRGTSRGPARRSSHHL